MFSHITYTTYITHLKWVTINEINLDIVDAGVKPCCPGREADV